MNTLQEYLQEFAGIADDWFAERSVLLKYYTFFQQLIEPETLARAQWQDMQAIGDHIHALGTNALARKRAFGNPNHPIEHYRASLHHLAHGDGPLPKRIDDLIHNPQYRIKYLGESSIGEMVGQIFADTYVLYNDRSDKALNILDIPLLFERGDKFGARYLKFNEAVAPVIAAYEAVVGKRTELPITIEVDQFLSWLYETYYSSMTVETHEKTRETVWLIAPGTGATYWDAFFEEGIIGIGWDALGDLRNYSNSAEIEEGLVALDPDGPRPHNTALACYEFANKMQPGDLILVKRGRKQLIGFGIIDGAYSFDEDRDLNKHVRSVDWLGKGSWSAGDRLLPTKTLTDITKYPDMAADLKKRVGYVKDDLTSANYWWLNCNPSIWNLSTAPLHYKETYTSHNEAGHKRQKYKHFLQVQPGDLVIGYESAPVMRIVALCRITKALYEDEKDGECFEFEKIAEVKDGPTWQALQALPELKDAEPIQSNQGSLFRLTAETYTFLTGLCDSDLSAPVSISAYTVDDALDGLFVDHSTFESWLHQLKTKKNVILQGPPGVGKTFVAKRLAYALIGYKDPARVGMVQFHQSYAYEDFIQGYRPSGEGFVLKNGLFYDFCKRAQQDPGNPYVFIIDEINRGNLSKIMGELMMLIEADKRSPDYAIPLTYSSHPDETFYVPSNLYLLGMMNTADRSLAMVDYALRRRFAFITLRPQFQSQAFKTHLKDRGSAPGLVHHIVQCFRDLNQQIVDDSTNLGAGFCIGHSYFCPVHPDLELDAAWYNLIIDNEIAPLIQEYWFDNPTKADKLIEDLRL